jgi:hypothetical protein
MACNTCHPHPPMDWGHFGYSELYVAVNTAFYEAREAVEKYTKAGADTGEVGTIPQMPPIIPDAEDPNGFKFIAEDGGVGGSLGPWKGLVTGSNQDFGQHYAAKLSYDINDSFTLNLGYIHTKEGALSDAFGWTNSGGSSMIPGIYHQGYWQQTGPGQSTYVEGYVDNAVQGSGGSDSIFFGGEISW